MKTFATDFIRNIALIGHSGEGKTSLAEAMLFETKSIDRLGKVDDGTATMDFDDEEIKRKISISMALASAVHKGVKLNILDVPGFFDFEGEMAAALSAADSAVAGTGASGSPPVGTEKALEMCPDKACPRLYSSTRSTRKTPILCPPSTQSPRVTARSCPSNFPLWKAVR